MKETDIKEPKEQPRQHQPQELPSEKQHQEKEFGEGNYKAAREYDKAAESFARSGKVDAAARAAAPRTPDEALELERAEGEGRSRSKAKVGGSTPTSGV